MTEQSITSERETLDRQAQRDRANVRLGWLFGGLALMLFLLAIWKYRPL